MNNESVFALRFVMKDFTKMRKAVEQINKNIEMMKKNADKASGSMNKLNTSMGKTIRTVGKFALAYFTLSKVISTTFKKAQETIQIDLMAQSAGIAADKIGKLGKVLRAYGGDARTAGAAYASLTDIIGGAQHGFGISQEIARVNAMYGIGLNYGNISQEELMTNIAVKMKELRGKNDQWAINQIASAYGLDASMANFLAEQGANWSNKVNREKFEKLSKSESRQLIESQETLTNQIEALMAKSAPLITQVLGVLEQMLPVLQAIADVLDMKWWKRQGERLGNWWSDITKTAPKEVSTQAKKEYARQEMLAGRLDYGKYLELMEKYTLENVKGNGFINIAPVSNEQAPITVSDNSTVKVELVNNSGSKIGIGNIKSDRQMSVAASMEK